MKNKVKQEPSCTLAIIRAGIFTRAGIFCPLVIVKSHILNMSADSYVNYLLAVRWIYAFHLSLNFSQEHSDKLF